MTLNANPPKTHHGFNAKARAAHTIYIPWREGGRGNGNTTTMRDSLPGEWFMQVWERTEREEAEHGDARVPTVPQKARGGDAVTVDADELLRLCDMRLSEQQIGDRLGLSASNVHYRLKRLGARANGRTPVLGETYYWCGHCLRRVPVADAGACVNGAAKCRRCGMKLRVKPRHYRRSRRRRTKRVRVEVDL